MSSAATTYFKYLTRFYAQKREKQQKIIIYPPMKVQNTTKCTNFNPDFFTGIINMITIIL